MVLGVISFSLMYGYLVDGVINVHYARNQIFDKKKRTLPKLIDLFKLEMSELLNIDEYELTARESLIFEEMYKNIEDHRENNYEPDIRPSWVYN